MPASTRNSGIEEQVRHKLDSILAPEGDLGQLELADVIDTKALQSLVDNFYTLTRLPMGLIDIKGKVLVGIGWQDICTRFHRVNPESCANCIESDVHLSRGVPAGEFKVYKCKNNMWDVATPIIVGNRHLGNLFMGQFFFEDEPVEYGFFRRQAARFGFDEDAYMAALHAVPRLGRETLATSMAFFMKLAEILSRLGYSNLKLARSLSERNALMEELRQAKEMAETATRTKSQFLANMSHELRTPMTGVLGMLEFALEGRLDHQQREYIETAHRSARSLLRILNDILDLTKVESGKFSLEERPFDLRACVDNAIDIIIPEVRRKGLDLIHVVTDDVPAVVVGDQMRLLQVLTNLCGNAVKFTDEGRVAVRVSCGSTLDDDRREIVFTIADSGIGIPDDKKGELFKPFSQVDDTNTRKHGGTGLGLAISKEFVAMMGGTISCESADGTGSRFSFTVPFSVTDTLPVRGDAGTPSAPPPSPLPETSRKHRILLAEDDQVTRQILGELLSRLNFTLDVAKDGLQAVEMWAEGEYDLVLMDVQMPRLDGYSATREIRRREESRGGHSLIVAMTAHAFEEDKEKCRQAGMDSYISKPLDLKQCIALLNSLLREGST
jgi:signal transduction histidine kinase/ActR/RegA family two-component response regulator